MRPKQLLFSVFLVISVLSLIVKVKADTPLPPPADYWISSQNNKFKAFFDVKNKTTLVYRIEKIKRKEKKEKIWQMEGWFRNTFLSNDGKNLVVAYNGANLLELDYKIDEVMISFYNEGNLLNQIRLNQLIENPLPEKLERTTSHFKWVSTYGINAEQMFEINTVAKKQFLFDLKTGLSIGADLYSTDEVSSQKTEKDNTNIVVDESSNNSNKSPDINSKNQNKNNCQLAVFLITGIIGVVSEVIPKISR
jgi:hypothetical protein